MAEPAAQYTARYAKPSGWRSHGSPTLALVADAGADHTPFVEGRLADPALTGATLLALQRVVRTRFYLPPSMVQRLIQLSDPVVTRGEAITRFEGFSPCRGVYARVDLLDEGLLDVEEGRPGTTNVDFGDAMRGALARLSHESDARLSVDADEVALHSDEASVIERVVPLPASWLRGFTETQVLASQAEHAFSLDRVRATRALQALTRLDARTAAHARPTATGIRVSTRATADSVPIAGGGRLEALSALAPRLQRLDVWRHPTGCSAWVLDLGSHRLTWMISPALDRGFSGEGASLDQEAPEVGTPALRGNAGWDFALGDWFPRVLPWSADAQARVHPRQRRALRLLEQGAVTLLDGDVAEVRTSSGVQRVRTGDRRHCTCTWIAKHDLDRGPCAHLLAVELARAER